MPSIRMSTVVVAAAVLAACSGSSPPGPPPAANRASAPAAADAAAAKELVLYDQMRASQSWDLAASLGGEIVQKYPASAAAATVKQTLDDVRAKASAQRESHRLAKLWSYAAVPEAGGTQYTAAIESREPLNGGSGKSAERVRLVLRVHPKWGRSVYLLLDNATFDCRKGCATLPVRFDDAPAQRMKATIPPTGEPALFIDDDKGFLAKMEKAKSVSIDVVIKSLGAKTLTFEVGGYDPTKLPAAKK